MATIIFFFHSRKNVDSRQEETMLTGAMRREKQKKTQSGQINTHQKEYHFAGKRTAPNTGTFTIFQFNETEDPALRSRPGKETTHRCVSWASTIAAGMSILSSLCTSLPSLEKGPCGSLPVADRKDSSQLTSCSGAEVLGQRVTVSSLPCAKGL